MSVDDETPDWAAMADAAEEDDPGQMPGEPLRDPEMRFSPLNEPRYSDPEKEADRLERVRHTLESKAAFARYDAAYVQAQEELAMNRGLLYREGLPPRWPENRAEIEPADQDDRAARRVRLEWERSRQGMGRWWMRLCYWGSFGRRGASGEDIGPELEIPPTLAYNRGAMSMHDVAAARQIALRFEGALLAVAGVKRGRSRFLRWNGSRWVTDVGETLANKAVDDFWRAMRMALDWIRLVNDDVIHRELAKMTGSSDSDVAKKKASMEKTFSAQINPYEDFYKNLGGDGGRRAVKNQLAEMPGLLIAKEDLDVDPHLLNYPNGTLDLRGLEFRDADPWDRITLSTTASYEVGAPCPEFQKHLERFLPDVEVRTYLQRLVGYGLLGEVRHHLLPMLVGDGSNGKGTLIRALQNALGGYMIEVSAEMLLNQTNPSHPTDLMDLRGARIVSMQETAQNRSLNAAKMKSLTGGDRIRAHWMHADNEEFLPSHLFLMSTNHKPRPEEFDGGVWRRIRIIPFDVMLPKEEEDSEIDHKLAAEAEGVLAWCVEGYRQYAELGGRLPEPEAVLKATNDYREESDAFRAFGDLHLVPVDGARTTPAAILLRWKTWADQHGERLLVTHRTLRDHMRRIGYTNWRKVGSVRFYEGVALKEETWADLVDPS